MIKEPGEGLGGSKILTRTQNRAQSSVFFKSFIDFTTQRGGKKKVQRNIKILVLQSKLHCTAAGNKPCGGPRSSSTCRTTTDTQMPSIHSETCRGQKEKASCSSLDRFETHCLNPNSIKKGKRNTGRRSQRLEELSPSLPLCWKNRI